LTAKIGTAVRTVGLVMFAIHQLIGIPLIVSLIPVISMILIAAAGVMALIKSRMNLGSWLLASVIFAALATFRDTFVSALDRIEAYHYLVAISVLCFGLAASRRTD
jgi:hypothetical protein